LQEKIQEQFKVNVFEIMDFTLAMLPHLREHRRRLTINFTSSAVSSDPESPAAWGSGLDWFAL
jgi:short-subunit dehydrogenase